MAKGYTSYDGVCEDPIHLCKFVYLCLDAGWEAKTVSGFPFVEARVYRIDKLCTEDVVSVCCKSTTRQTTFCRYYLEYDESSLKIDPSTSKPYVIATEDVLEVIPYHCMVSKFMDYILSMPDHVLDYENTTITTDNTANTITSTFPVIDRVNNISIGQASLVQNGGTLAGDLPSSVITYTSSAGKVFTVDVGDLFESQIDGSTIVRDPLSGIYSSVTSAPPIPDLTLVTNNNCTTQGVSGYYVGNIAVAGHEITLQRYPEHFALCEIARYAGQNYLTPVEVATLATGDSNIQSPAFISFLVNNPSSCREIRAKVVLTGSFAASSTPGTGFVVWGHSLWINGVKITDRNGRSNAGFNISWADGTGLLQDYTLPTIEYPITIPAGGSVTIGADFGDNDTFATVGTTTTLSLESRQISVIGGTI